MPKLSLRNNSIRISLIILLSFILDDFFINKIIDPPAWDQGYHLSNVFKMYNILDDYNLKILDKFNELLKVTESYRGPLTYFLSAIFIKFSENTYHNAYLSNQIFSVVCILSIFNLGKVYKKPSVGLWGAIIFTFSSLIINQRSDYLIDLSLTSFCTLNLLFFTKWYLDDQALSKFSILSGFTLGLIFLTKPTGIVFFIFPLILIIFKLIKKKNNFNKKVCEIIAFISFFILTIFPWFSKNWLTIITSTINAWNWGVNYQDGLEAYSVESWIYYLKNFPSLFGVMNFSIFSVIFILEKIIQRNIFTFDFKQINKTNLFLLSYAFNCYLITALMSSKDIRFILPVYPLVCLYFSKFILSKEYKIFSIKSKKIILLISISISLFFSENGIIYNSFKIKDFNKWPHNQIILEIKKENPNLISTLAIIPDTKEINTFNLEAEASRQGENVMVRQVISNKKTYKDDLKYFDWFLVKTGDQGIMFNEAKSLLNQYLIANPTFIIHKEWDLNDHGKLILYRRKILNTYLTRNNCTNDISNLDIKNIKNGINLSLFGKGKLLKSANLLIDFFGDEFKESINISLANDFFNKSFDTNECFNISQNISFSFPKEFEKKLLTKARLLDQDGNIKKLIVNQNNFNLTEKFDKQNYIQMENRISKVEDLGMYLKNGEFKSLFDLVGIMNQSDPKQIYLKNAERIYMQRYNDEKNLDNLYSILICQILQKKVNEAQNTINLILQSDNKNGNAHLAKSIISIYLFNKKEARIAIENAKLLEKSKESNEIIKTIEGITLFLEMKFIDSYKTFI